MIEDFLCTQFAPWHDLSISRDEMAARVREHARGSSSVQIFEIDDGAVRIIEKNPNDGPVPSNEWHINALRHRGEVYRAFIEAALRIHGVRGRVTIGVHLDDMEDQPSGLPIFCFQKPRGSRNLQLPDIETLSEDFYVADQYWDSLSFDEKEDRAVFVGSTTGPAIVPWTDESAIASPRLSAAIAFRDDPTIDFFLPSLVGVDPEVAEMIKAAGVYGRRMSWGEQLHSKFLISIDGHGAACSRLCVALRSQSVVLKYDSPHELYFFGAMQPWRHYVPIARNTDVRVAIAELAERRGLYADIAAEGYRFMRRTLSRLQVLEYTARLIEGAIARFGSGAARHAAADFAIDGFGHFSNLGNRYGAPADWIEAGGAPIEGFVLEPGPYLADDDLVYRGIDAVRGEGASVIGREFCGSRGEAKPLNGFRISLRGRSAQTHQLSYAARFADGHETTFVAAGIPLARGAPLTGIRLKSSRTAP